MKLSLRLTGRRLTRRRRFAALAGVGALVVGGLVAIPTAAYAAPGCTVTYQKAWDNGSGFGANVNITNTGDPITNGWSMVFTFPGNQRVDSGWPVAWTQPAGSNQVTVASNADWNRALATGVTLTTGFNGTYSGPNVDPTSFSLNGTPCNGGGPGNTPPTVSLTSPTAGQSFPAGSTIPMAATASDNTGVARVEFLIDGAVVGTDTTSPYSFSATGAASGSHTAQARAVDTGSPALSTTTPATTFNVGGTTTPAIIATPAALSLASGASGTVNIRRNTAPTANVTVTITRTGSTALTCPTSVTLTPTNATAGVNITCTAATGTSAEAATFTAAATGHTSATFSVTRTASGGPGRQDNPYVGATGYNNPQWRAQALLEPGGNRIASQPTGVWLDRISAIAGNGSPTTGSMGLAAHLDQAVAQDTANGASAMVIQIVIYNLPGRDCAALASNGELGPNDLPRYKTEYIDPIAAIMARPAYTNLRIVAVIEIDSLPNLVTNVSGRPTETTLCNTMLQNRGYVDGVGYALAKLGAIPNVYNYIDAAHHGWIGWDDNFGATANMMATAANASGSTPANVHGFITNTANTSALTEQFVGPLTEQLRNTRWIDFNRYNEELAFAQAFRTRLVQAGFQANIGMLIDTSRNGWGNCVVAPCAAGGAARPTAPSTSTDPNTFVNQSRIDRRIHKGNWCNQAGAGLGERPRAAPAAGIDAYVWIKPPGESDGSSTEIPNNEGKGFDRMCDPTYGGNARNGNSMSGALPGAPLSGHWFSAQFQQLMANAFPPL